MGRVVLATLLAGFISVPLFAYNPPQGAPYVGTLSSAPLTADGAGVVSTASPGADMVNPAASGGITRPRLSADYLALVGASPLYSGTIANLAGSFPTNFGVYNGSLHFFTSTSPLDLGTFGIAHFSFSKQLYPNLLIGSGLDLTLGNAATTDWGLGFDFGFINTPGDIGILKNFRWGAAIENVGKPFEPIAGFSGIPPPFTPAIGAAFDLVRSRSFSLGLSSTISFPSFQDVGLSIGTTLSIADSFDVNLSSNLDLHQLQGGTQPFPLSGGISLTFRTTLPSSLSRLTKTRSARTEVSPTLAVLPLPEGRYAAGGGLTLAIGQIDREPPRIAIVYPQTQYFSPLSSVRSALEVPVKITDDRFVESYKLSIYDEKGNLVRTVSSPVTPVRQGGAEGVLNRLLLVKSGIPIPPYLTWDGTNNAGARVPDGRYTFTVSATDQAGNSATSASYPVVVDTKAPRLTLVQPSSEALLFSPNGNGVKDTLSITQSGSVEPLWTGTFVNAQGRVVRTITWRDSAPKDFVWNGKDDNGDSLPDGIYSYHITATNRAGIATSGEILGITLDTSAPPVRLAVNRDYFSPGTSSSFQNVIFTLGIPASEPVVSWQLAIKNPQGQVVRSVAGGRGVPTSFVFDGADQAGNPLPDGTYSGTLSVVYRNGNSVSATSPNVNIDRALPTASVGADYTVFSPVHDSVRNVMIFYATASNEPAWHGVIATAGGSVVKRYTWAGVPDSQIVWDGRGSDGRVEPDGTYQFWIASTSPAGNYGQSNIITFTLDSQHKKVFLSTDYTAFSPNGPRNLIHIIPEVRTTAGVISYSVQVENSAGTSVASFSGTVVPTGHFTWDGLGPKGSPVPEGEYHAVIALGYTNGTMATASTPPFAVVTTLPSVQARADYLIFSPDGHSSREAITIHQTGNSRGSWTGRILSSAGKVVRQIEWSKALPESFTWDGRDNNGNLVPDGTYTYQVSTTDDAGNSAQAEVTGIVVDVAPTRAYITVGATGFSPNGDGVDDTIALYPVASPNTGVARWQVVVARVGGGVVRTWSGQGSPPASVVWNGTGPGGLAPDGEYEGSLVVEYVKGDRNTAVTHSFKLVTKPPTVKVTLSPLPFEVGAATPASRLKITIAVSSAAPVGRFRLVIRTPPVEEPYAIFTGVGAPAPIEWDGRSSSGQLGAPGVYSYILTVQDIYGNTTLTTGNIPIVAPKNGNGG